MTAPPEAMPPVPTVYVSTSVLFVVPAVAEVGLIEALPEPSAPFDTATVLDGVVARVVTVPPLVDFDFSVKMLLPAFAAEGAVAAPPLEEPVSP